MIKEELIKKYPGMMMGRDGEWIYFEANAQRFSCEPVDDETDAEEMLDDESFCSFLDSWFLKSE